MSFAMGALKGAGGMAKGIGGMGKGGGQAIGGSGLVQSILDRNMDMTRQRIGGVQDLFGGGVSGYLDNMKQGLGRQTPTGEDISQTQLPRSRESMWDEWIKWRGLLNRPSGPWGI
jgi:hypothetical protein